MLVSVTERTSEIGLLKALGVTQSQVLGVFLAEAALLSGTGGAGGLLLAQAAVGVLREVLPALPAEIPLWSVAAALTVAVGVGILFGVWPALRASRLDPVIALAKK
jgi:putative ABC transport system permease protein